MLQEHHGNTAFSPKFMQENDPDWRNEINQMFEKLTTPFTDPDFPNVKLLPLWHGTKPEVISSILRVGYANLATTDEGYFGKGLYSTCEAEYAHRVYSKGVLVVNWVSMYSAYPVIHGDMPKLQAKGNYQNYDAHFIPVVSPNVDDPYSGSIYYPSRPNQSSHYNEVVVFESMQCLPRYLVELQPTLIDNPPQTLSALYHSSGIGFHKQNDDKEKPPDCKLM